MNTNSCLMMYYPNSNWLENFALSRRSTMLGRSRYFLLKVKFYFLKVKIIWFRPPYISKIIFNKINFT